MHEIMYWVICCPPRVFNANMKGHVKRQGTTSTRLFLFGRLLFFLLKTHDHFEQTAEKMKWTVTDLRCTNLAYTLKPCLSPVVSKRLVGFEFPLLLGNLARLFGNRGVRKSEGLTSCRRFEVVRLRSFILFE